MNIPREKIFGKLTDLQGRCVHYNSELDVIANRCSVCKKLYACYKCHDEAEDHKFSAVSEEEKKTVMCGVCGNFFNYREYSSLSQCPVCKSYFNPRCALHKNIYSCQSSQQD